MYPAQELADGVYTVNDLPDVLLVRLGDPPDTLVYKTGGTGPAYFGVNEETQQEVSIYLVQSFENPELAQWQINPGGLEISCLIDVFVEDQFANSYTVAPNIGDSASPTIVTRISLCVWRGTDACGNFVYLSYGLNPDGGQDIMWNVFFRFYTPTCLIDGQVDGQKNDDEFENTPVGTYSGTLEDAAFVS